LVGPIIVEETDKPDFDEDIVLGLKDWLLNDDGSFKPFTSPRNAAAMATLGNITVINGIVSNATSAEGKPVISYDIPAGGAVRQRFFNMDNTREVNQHYADTVLVGKYEMITIALKATNLRKWMFHCHVIEHMKTGLMGYIEVKA
jgi:FtsP/CotA-like multicopper oxidase with cupredoxin domain